MARPRLNEPVPETDQEEPVPLAVKYRPSTFREFLGNQQIVGSIKTGLASNNRPRAYLLIGPSGVGKTTLARLIAKQMDVPERNLIEIDATRCGKVEDVREIVDIVAHHGLIGGELFVIIDECHMLTRFAWQVFLKPIEEAGQGVYWVLCTTEEDKVPNTIKTRCQTYRLAAMGDDLMQKMLDRVADAEQMAVSDKVVDYIIDQSVGSPRQALQYLNMLRECTRVLDAKQIISHAEAGDKEYELIKTICSGRGMEWRRVLRLLNDATKKPGFHPEGFRINLVNYAAKVLIGTTNERDALHLLSVIDNFSSPFMTSEKHAPLLLALGSMVFGGTDE